MQKYDLHKKYLIFPNFCAKPVFIVVVKFYLKKRLNGGRVAIAGLIVGILIAIISFIIGYIDYDPTNPNYTLELYMNPWAFVGGVVAEGIITMVAFIVLYAITKPVYNKLRKT